MHQRIAVRFDEAQRLVTGRVTTTVVPTEPTDTVRLDAELITIDKAENEAGRSLRFTSDTDHVTVRLGRRAAAGDTVVFTLAYHTHPERGIYFVPRKRVVWSHGEAEETRAWVPTYDHANDKTTWEMLVTADSAMKVPVQRQAAERRAGGQRRAPRETPAMIELYSRLTGVPFPWDKYDQSWIF